MRRVIRMIGGAMSAWSWSLLASYWSESEQVAGVVMLLNLVGALALGLVVGYERTFHGRAAGMRTYGIVCMASAALTVLVGYPGLWYGGHSGVLVNADPTRVIQGIVTGIGFLGAGVIMKEGFNISGLTTAASIWASSVIGVLVGVGFYLPAICLTCLCVLGMMWVSRLERWLPSHPAIAINVGFNAEGGLTSESLRHFIIQSGYAIAPDTLAITGKGKQMEWRFVAIAKSRRTATAMAALSKDLSMLEGVESFTLTHARN